MTADHMESTLTTESEPSLGWSAVAVDYVTHALIRLQNSLVVAWVWIVKSTYAHKAPRALRSLTTANYGGGERSSEEERKPYDCRSK